MWLSCLGVVCVLACGAGDAGAQTSTALLVQISEQALVAGDAEQALAFAQLAVAQDPNNYAALILTALAYADLENDRAAAAAAGRAFDAAKDSNERLQAGRIAAGARFQLEQHMRAQWWLRRVANDADTPQEVSHIAQEFRQIRAANPLSVQLGFSVAPSDNINNGSEADSFFLEGLDFEFFLPSSSLALGGVEFSGDVTGTYDLSRGSRHRTQLQAYLFGRTYALSDRAKEIAPHVAGNDYAMVMFDTSINHRQVWLDVWGPTDVSVHLGKTWFGGDPLWDYGKLYIGQTLQLGPRDALNFDLTAERRYALNTIQSDTWIYDISATHSHTFANEDIVTFQVSTTEHRAAYASDSFTDKSANLNYQFAQPILGAAFAASVGIGQKDYEYFSLSLDGRHDQYISAGANVTLGGVSYLGFSPTLSLTAKRNISNVTQFTSSQVQARIGIQSTF